MKKILMTSILLAQVSAHAVLAPWYQKTRDIDAAVRAVAAALNVTDVSNAKISEIIVFKDDTIEVAMNGQFCFAYLKTISREDMRPGPAEIAVEVGHCEVVRAKVIPTKPYIEVKAAIDEFAKRSQIVSEVVVDESKVIRILTK